MRAFTVREARPAGRMSLPQNAVATACLDGITRRTLVLAGLTVCPTRRRNRERGCISRNSAFGRTVVPAVAGRTLERRACTEPAARRCAARGPCGGSDACGACGACRAPLRPCRRHGTLCLGDHACAGCSVACVAVLLDAGAEADAVDSLGRTALHVACRCACCTANILPFVRCFKSICGFHACARLQRQQPRRHGSRHRVCSAATRARLRLQPAG